MNDSMKRKSKEIRKILVPLFFFVSNLKKRRNFILHDYEIEVNNSNNLKDNTMLNCSMELSLLNNLFRENLITEAEKKEIKRKNPYFFVLYICNSILISNKNNIKSK